MKFFFNDNDIVAFLEKIINTDSITGNTDVLAEKLIEIHKKLGFNFIKTNKGGLLGHIKGEDSSKISVITAHFDTLGAMVNSIENGKIKITKINGYINSFVEGCYCKIETQSKKVYTGTILPTAISAHAYNSSDIKTMSRVDNELYIRLDERIETKEDIQKLGIDIGDFVAFDPKFVYTDSGYIKSRFLDDKAGIAAIFAFLINIIKNKDIKIKNDILIYYSNYEEVGYGANSNIPENAYEMIAIDMGVVGKDQNSDERAVSICVKDSSGPYDRENIKMFTEICKKKKINYRLDVYPHYGSDASSALRAGNDIKVSLIGPGVDASHAYERTHIKAIESTTKLLCHYFFV